MKTEWQVFDEFYNKQREILSSFKERLLQELQRYAEQVRGVQRKCFVFQLGIDVSLEELPILFLKLEKEPPYPFRLLMYSPKERVAALEKIEDFLRLLEIAPVARSPEITEILLKWKNE
jgi:hypothetical protein